MKANYLQRFAHLAIVLFALALHHEAIGQRTAARLVPPSLSTQTASQGLTQSSEQITINTDVVTVTVAVTDAQGRHIVGLDKSAFTLADDKIPREIEYFSDDDSPASIRFCRGATIISCKFGN